MPRLKNRNHWLPSGFQVLHPEAGMQQPFSGSFRECVDFEFKFRRGNPHITQKNGWTLNVQEIEWYVEQQNVARMLAHGWDQYLLDDHTPAPPPYQPKAQKKTFLGNAVGAARTTKAAVHLYLEWLGDSGQPVAHALAEKRAAVCCNIDGTGAPCPNNKQGGLRNFFIEAAAKEILSVFGIMNDMDLATSRDEQLGVCEACLCPMKSKVWAKIDHIRKHLTPDAASKLHPSCWIPIEK